MIQRCPKCRGAMRKSRGEPLHQCEACSGVWAEAGALAEVTGTESDLRNVFPPRGETSFSCPRGCGAKLEEVRYSKLDADLWLDRCPVCGGVFLDAGELDRVVALNERIRVLFGDGTFKGPGRGKGLGARLRRIFGGG